MLGHCFEVENKLIKAVHIETVKRKNEKKKKEITRWALNTSIQYIKDFSSAWTLLDLFIKSLN